MNAAHPEEVQVSRPSDALTARAAAKTAFTSLFLGLGAVALLVGGIGVANVMVVAVLERRSEIGLRRALGAPRRYIRWQFLTESLMLSGIGGAAGVATGLSDSRQLRYLPRLVRLHAPAGSRRGSDLPSGHRGTSRPVPGDPSRPPVAH